MLRVAKRRVLKAMVAGGLSHCCLAVLALAFVCRAQDAPAPATAVDGQKRTSDYVIGSSDVLQIMINGISELNRQVVVSNSGKIHVPQLGVLSVAGLTTNELQSRIADLLIQRQLVKKPSVLVSVQETRGQTVYILGEVMQPGQYVLKRDLRIMDLMSLGMGLGEGASRVAYLYRRKETDVGPVEAETDGSAYECITIDLGKLFEEQTPELNLPLRGGDMLYCPLARPLSYYVVGDVVRPGGVAFPAGRNLRASQAIAMVGGPLRTARIAKGILVRTDLDGTRREIPLDFAKIMNGHAPDVAVLPNDIIFVPGSSAKTLAYGLLGIIPGVAQRSVTGL
jgi:polysaccharide export outer membrane protein